MSLFPQLLVSSARALLAGCRKRKLTLATAESCTGGLIAALLTEIPGASDVFTHGFVTYANAAKQKLLDVNAALIKKHGAVSAEVAEAMVKGTLKAAKADLAVAVTGIAGPKGGIKEKPVGLVYIAALRKGKKPVIEKCYFKGTRTHIRLRAAEAALKLLFTVATA